MKWFTPSTLEELAEALRQAGPGGQLVAGGTDYTIRLRQGKAVPEALIYPGGIPAFRELTLTEEALRVGAMVTMVELNRFLSSVPAFAAIADAAGGVGSPQIRSKATMIGNLCNASPAGDMLPIAKLYDMRLEVLDEDGSLRTVPVSEFLLGPGKTVLKPGEAVVAAVARRKDFDGCISAFYKIGFRSYVSIARIGMGGLIRLDEDHRVTEARFTLGAVANVPIRVPEAEAVLQGRILEEAPPEALVAAVSQTVHDNCRPANRLYKTEAARGLCAELFARLSKRAQG